MFIRSRIIPVLLIDDRDLIKTVQFDKRTYLGDPVNAVKIFNRKRIDEMAILDIGASKGKREPDFEFLKDIASEAFMPLSYGGGLTNMNQIENLFKIGYEKAVLNTSFVVKPDLVKEAVSYAGSQSVVVSIDAKEMEQGCYRCVIQDGTQVVDLSPVEAAIRAESFGVGELLINSIDRDGMMQGYDYSLIKSIAESVSIPIIACGGASGVPDLYKVIHESGAHAAAGGSMFVFYGKLKAVLITAPSEAELIKAGIYSE